MDKIRLSCITILAVLVFPPFLPGETGVAFSAASHSRGAYAGITGGMTHLKTYDVNRLDVSSAHEVSNDTGPAGNLSNQTNSPTAGIFGGFDYSVGPMVFGLEGDFMLPGGASINNSGGQEYANYREFNDSFATTALTHIPWMTSLRPKAGVKIPGGGVIYLTAGPALARVETEHTITDTLAGFRQASRSDLRSGYTVGAGITLPVSDALSFEARYLRSNFGTVKYRIRPADGSDPYQESNKVQTSAWLVGLSYQFIPGTHGGWFDETSNFTLESGLKMGVGLGSLGAPQPLLNSPSARIPHVLSSRLIWDDMTSYYGETFVRLDHISHLFGILAFQSGHVSSGHLYDEDFPLPGRGYSITKADISGIRSGISVSAGYNFIENRGSRLGIFSGFERREYSLKSSNWCQLADSNPCAGENIYAPGDYVSRESKMNFWKVGLDGRLMLTSGTWVDINAAYIPVITFTGQDNHLARQFVVNDKADGNGASLEASLNHSITSDWSIGFGARYMTFRSKTGRATSQDLSLNPSSTRLEAGYTDDQLDLFVQTVYRFGEPLTAFSAPGQSDEKLDDWSGLYLGGLLGTAYLRDDWQDPFGNTRTPRGNHINYAGFGNSIRSAGVVGGVRAGYDKSFGPWVAGISFSKLSMHLSGQNTCFSGLRGLDCQRKADGIDILAGRLGWANEGTLFYVQGGAARLDGKLGINGRSFALYRGEGQDWKSEKQNGWLAGAGIERRINEHVSGYIEYNHIGNLHTDGQIYNAAAALKNQPLSTKGKIDMVTLGVNYRF